MKRVLKKLRSENGETLVETLVSILIVSLCILMLAGSMVASARVNKAAKEQLVSFQTKDPVLKTIPGSTVTIDRSEGADSTLNGDVIIFYESGRKLDGADVYDGYYFYELK